MDVKIQKENNVMKMSSTCKEPAQREHKVNAKRKNARAPRGYKSI